MPSSSWPAWHSQGEHTKPNRALWAKAKEDTIAEEKTEKGTTDLCLDKPQSFWENVLWTDETKIEIFGNAHQQFVYRWRNEAYKEKNTLPTVKHGGGLDCITGIMKSENYREILEWNVRPSVRKLGLSQRSWVLQQHKDPKHTSTRMQEWLKRKKMDWYKMASNESWSQSDSKSLGWAEICYWGKEPCNVQELEQIAKEEWEKIPAEKSRSLKMATRNVWRLSSLPKGVQPNIKEGCRYCCTWCFFCFFFEITICKLKKQFLC